jgi:hypothetical protein
VLLTVVIILYCATNGWLSENASNFLMVFVIAIGAITWGYRWYFTSYVRDRRYWNRRTFAQDMKLKAAGELCIGSDSSDSSDSS